MSRLVVKCEEELYICPCSVCGVRFGISSDFENARRADKGTFYCPNGHPLSWSESEADKLRRERDRLKQENARLEELWHMAQVTANDQREQKLATERKLAAQKGVTTRLKNRVSNGVCPCCNRTFANLQRHMATKHADFVAEDVQAEAGVTIQ